MAYTASEIVKTACQIAKAPGYGIMAGQMLNAILEELYTTNDFAFLRKTVVVDCTQQQPTNGFVLPADHQRTLEVFYDVDGSRTFVTQVPIEQYDGMYQGISGQSYPQFFAVDVAPDPNTIYFNPTPPMAVPVTIRYMSKIDPITSPESSLTVPWFPMQMYLITRLASELMMVTDDTRRDQFLRDGEKMLSKFLIMGEDDREGYARQVKLDSRSFRSSVSLKATKTQPL